MNTRPIRNVIDAISRDSLATESPERIAKALMLIYPHAELKSAMRTMLSDDSWSSDGQSYVWLDSIYRLM